MLYNIDLRFTIPLLLNVFLLALNSSKETLLLPVDISNGNKSDHPYFFLLVVVWLFLVIFILLFLLTSVKLNVSLEIFPICLRFGDFSGPLALSLLASLLLPLPLFCIAYFICICISPWFSLLVELLVQFCRWFIQLVQVTPTFQIVGISQSSQETVELEPSLSSLLNEADTDHALEIVVA